MPSNLFIGGNQRRKPICLGLCDDNPVERITSPSLVDHYVCNKRKRELANTNAYLMLDLQLYIPRWQLDSIYLVEILQFDEHHRRY